MPAPAPDGASPVSFRGLTLFPFQQRAIDAIFSGRSVVVAAPTGAGKTLVADFAIEQALARERRVVYTSPIKALSNQKYRDFRAHYGDARVGIMTGDVTMQPEAPVLVMTTEIFRNTIFEDPERLASFDFVVFDEVHYLDDRERGTVWEEAILYAPPHIRIVALSATVPNVADFADWIAKVRESPVEVIVETTRPVPLVHKVWVPGRGPRSLPEVRKHLMEMGRQRHDRPRRGGRPSWRAREEARQRAVDALFDHLQEHRLLPAIHFCFNRLDCERIAQANARRDLLTVDERERMLDLFDEFAARYRATDAQDTRALRELARRGVLFHHAGMLPIDKEIVERLFTTGLVKLLVATETFALGVNMPARSVSFHSLVKYDGVTERPILGREYWQMAGRAGRQGIDERGHVFALLDEQGVGIADLEHYHSGRTEPVRSRFNLNYGGILNLYRRVGEGVVDAWLRSFARHQRAKKGAKDELPRSTPGSRTIRARLDVLRDLSYVDEAGNLTRRGELCSKINGYEIAVTEAHEGGALFRCDPIQAAMLFAAMVYDPRPQDASAPATKSLKGIARPFAERMAEVQAFERARGLTDLTRGPDFGLSGIVQRWAEGEEFDAVLSRTSLAPGDLVRVLRMSIQMLRQAYHALPGADPIARTLREARLRLDRDVVDARRQLELG